MPVAESCLHGITKCCKTLPSKQMDFYYAWFEGVLLDLQSWQRNKSWKVHQSDYEKLTVITTL